MTRLNQAIATSAPAPDKTPKRKIRPASVIVPRHKMIRNAVESNSSQSGGSDGKRTIFANGAEKGIKVAIRSKGLSGAVTPSGITAMQAIRIKRTGVVKVCASCMEEESEPSAIKKAPYRTYPRMR